MVVADLGAGTGYFLPKLSAAVGGAGKVIGLDIEPDMVRYMGDRAAREGLGNVEARRCSVDDPALGEAEVDRILIVDTWHHIPDRERYIPKLVRALRPGGVVMVVDFNPTSRRGPPLHHRVPEAQVATELRAAGLDAEVLTTELEEQFVVVGRLR